MPFGLRLRRQTFGAADAQQFHSARQLPALRQGNGRADARVGAGPKPDGQTLDLFALHFGSAQRFVDQMPRTPACRTAGFNDLGQTRCPRSQPRRCVAARKIQAPESS